MGRHRSCGGCRLAFHVNRLCGSDFRCFARRHAERLPERVAARNNTRLRLWGCVTAAIAAVCAFFNAVDSDNCLEERTRRQNTHMEAQRNKDSRNRSLSSSSSGAPTKDAGSMTLSMTRPFSSASVARRALPRTTSVPSCHVFCFFCFWCVYCTAKRRHAVSSSPSLSILAHATHQRHSDSRAHKRRKSDGFWEKRR